MTVDAVFELVEIDAADGTYRFWPGQDGIFVDVNGNQWYGSALARVGAVAASIDGIAPTVELSLSYYQDPSAPDLINDIKQIGLDHVKGREVRFYAQFISSIGDMYAPTEAPRLFTTRFASALSFQYDGVANRKISLTCTSFASKRNQARPIAYNVEGHKELLGGVANPSLTYMPDNEFQPESLFF